MISDDQPRTIRRKKPPDFYPFSCSRMFARDRRGPVNGGAGGIRTLDTLLTYTHFPGERLRPLGHRSACSGAVRPSGLWRLSQGSLLALADRRFQQETADGCAAWFAVALLRRNSLPGRTFTPYQQRSNLSYVSPSSASSSPRSRLCWASGALPAHSSASPNSCSSWR